MFLLNQRRFVSSSTIYKSIVIEDLTYFLFILKRPFIFCSVSKLPSMREMGIQFNKEIIYDIAYDFTCFNHDCMTCEGNNEHIW